MSDEKLERMVRDAETMLATVQTVARITRYAVHCGWEPRAVFLTETPRAAVALCNVLREAQPEFSVSVIDQITGEVLAAYLNSIDTHAILRLP